MFNTQDLLQVGGRWNEGKHTLENPFQVSPTVTNHKKELLANHKKELLANHKKIAIFVFTIFHPLVSLSIVHLRLWNENCE